MTRLALVGLAGSALCGIKAIEFSTASFEPALGKQYSADYRTGYFRPEGYTDVIEALSKRVPRGGRAYMLGHLFAYDLPCRSWTEFLFVHSPLYWWVRDAGGAERVRIRARQAGLTQIAWQPLGGLAILGRRPWLSDWTPDGLRAYRGFWMANVREVGRIRDWVIFDVQTVRRGAASVRGTEWNSRTLPGTEGITGPADLAWQAARVERDGTRAAALRTEAARLAREAVLRYPDFPDARRRAREYGGRP
jgi:hypothetical protein